MGKIPMDLGIHARPYWKRAFHDRTQLSLPFSPPIRIGGRATTRVRHIKIVVSFFENGWMPIAGPSLAPLIKSHPHRPRGLHKSGEVAPLTIRKKDRISEIAVNGTVQRPPASVFAPAKVKKTVKKYETLFPTPRPGVTYNLMNLSPWNKRERYFNNRGKC